MPSRSRSFDTKFTKSGTYWYQFGGTTTGSMQVGLDGTCDDVIGNYPNSNPFTCVKRNRQYPVLNGTQVDFFQNPLRVMTNYPIGFRPGPADPSAVFPALTTLDFNNYAWRTLSEGNPSAPDVSLPTFVAELKDLPSLMKNWYGMFTRSGQDLSRYLNSWRKGLRSDVDVHQWNLLTQVPELIASGHLSWRWAIAPFIRDFNLLLDASYLIKKRLGVLNKLASGKSIRTRVALGKMTIKQQGSYGTLHSEGPIIYGRRNIAYTSTVWGTVRYKVPNGKLFPILGADKPLARARRLVFGISTHEALATAWELMPWSWFVDWFANIGTVIKATNNALGLVHGDICIMRHTTSETSIDIDSAASSPWVSVNGEYRETVDRKERTIAFPLLPFAPTNLPVLTDKALSILGSLFVLKQKPSLYLRAR